MTKDERFVIFASSLGTVFEWYDFYLFGSLASIIGAQFFGVIDPATGQPMFTQATRDIFALLAFGQLFGFFGVLLALPASAALLVWLRYLRGRYLGSGVYNARSG